MQSINHRGRITSRHGTFLPPKKKKTASGYITLQFIINGTIPSKKNMIWADSNIRLLLKDSGKFTSASAFGSWLYKGLKVFIRNSKKYTAWVEATKSEIQRQGIVEAGRYEKYGIKYPLESVSVKVYHYWNDNQERDNSNKYDTIIDLFVLAGILNNDCWQVVHRNESEADIYKGQILDHITTIDITCWL